VKRSAFDPCVVVSHSLGGLAALAAEPLYSVAPGHRVFVSAVTPAPGTAALDALPPVFRAYLRVRLRNATRKGHAIHLLPQWLAKIICFHDLDRSDRDSATRPLCAESPAIPTEPMPAGPTAAHAATYLALTRDRALRPSVQRRMAHNRNIRDVRMLDARTRGDVEPPRTAGVRVESRCSLRGRPSATWLMLTHRSSEAKQRLDQLRRQKGSSSAGACRPIGVGTSTCVCAPQTQGALEGFPAGAS
jgi:alpha/beta hydrolase family protein